MLLWVTAGKGTRSCCPISQNRSKIGALSLGPVNFFNPAFLCRELYWGGQDEGEMRNTCLFLRRKTNFGKNILTEEAQLFHTRAYTAKSFPVNLSSVFFALLPPSQVCRIFCVSPTRSLFTTASEKFLVFIGRSLHDLLSFNLSSLFKVGPH